MCSTSANFAFWGSTMAKKESTKDKIIRVSTRMFLDYGYSASSVKMVCDELGISKGNYTLYFHSKDDIEQLKADIKALTEGQNLTDEERADLAELDAKLDALLKKIADTKAEIDRANEAVNAYDEDTVKSTDSEVIEQLKEDIQSLIDSGNVTEEEITALEEKLEETEALTDKIAKTEQQLEEIAGIENIYNHETVTSDDKAAIKEAIAEIEAVNPDNLTNEQRKEYEEIKTGLEALLDKISAATLQVDMQ